ncbi:Mitochondrial substrate carrier family protein [Arabidopsis thaliana]|nr:Mitochondrial substrate carrier family protein [Arabidopsis thaliana]AEE28069.1 Mitochondrial substrate carrier family protein [Arabidopsis thaliana]|eukprot:NP_563776.1 Mitochondrial substrate carrier family protein [Arabidopsis thaliana]
MAVEDSTAPKFKEQDLQLWQLMIAGSVAGSFKNMTMFPVRTLDQRMLHRSYSQRHVGIRQALRSVIQTEGPSALYRGIWYMRHGAMGPAQFVHFSFYDVSKNFLSTGNPNNPVVHVISWAFTAVWSYAVSTPVDMAKLRHQNGFGNYKGVWDCAKRVTHEEGISKF